MYSRENAGVLDRDRRSAERQCVGSHGRPRSADAVTAWHKSITDVAVASSCSHTTTISVSQLDALEPAIKMVRHLPPAVKQLLTLRNPQPRPAPQLSKLNAVLTSTYQDARAKKVERGWLTLAVRMTRLRRVAQALMHIGHDRHARSSLRTRHLLSATCTASARAVTQMTSRRVKD